MCINAYTICFFYIFLIEWVKKYTLSICCKLEKMEKKGDEKAYVKLMF